MAEIIVTDKNFEEILSAGKKILLDFWATWCGPCQMIAPIVAQIAEENPDILVGKVDVDEQPQLAAAFGIASIPTLVIIEDKRVVKNLVGYRSKAEILEALGK